MDPSMDLPHSSLFLADQHLCSADILTPPEARSRIEVAVLSFLKTLASPNSPAIAHLPLITRQSRNSALRRPLLSDVSSLFLSHSFCTRSLSRPTDAKAFIRVWKVMEMCFKILGQGKMVTQRELFYKLLCDSPDYFTSQVQVNRAVQDVVALLRCTRQSLGIMASSRGAIAGCISLHEPGGEDVDCTVLGPAGHVITGDMNLLSRLVVVSDARYIVVVEKDAIFQRLAEDRLFSQIPCILITAKGYPDIATRFLLHRLSTSFPDMPLLALVDWNPAGLAILCTYKFGSINMGLEAYRYACNIKWLGLRGDDLQLIPQQSFVPLKPRDLQIAKSLMSSMLLQMLGLCHLALVDVGTFLPRTRKVSTVLTQNITFIFCSRAMRNFEHPRLYALIFEISSFLEETYRVELASMVESGRRAEIEALYYHGFDFLRKYIARKIVQSDYI